jgi:protein tyrosine phosphatase
LIVRTFTVTHAQSPDVTRELTQFQYTAWADHGLPVQNSFLNLLYLVDSYNAGGVCEEAIVAVPLNSSCAQGPICVHCSAGIGRSGTFCAVHRIIHEMNDHVAQHNSLPTVNIVQTLLDMRQQRHGMVQTKVDRWLYCTTWC